ncbi:MAG: DUF1353 domain-containing protein [Alphaproteobacteria bacterium]
MAPKTRGHMSSFTDPIAVEALPSGKFRLARAVTYEIGWKGSNWAITIPAKYETDFASIPAWATWIVPKFGRHNGAALLHDFAYSHLIDLPGSTADEIFFEALIVSGMKHWKTALMYLAVRLGGGAAYRRTRP